MRRLALLVLMMMAVGCGDDGVSRPQAAAARDGAAQLRAALMARGVDVADPGRRAGSLLAAWRGFADFVARPLAEDSGDDDGAGLLFELARGELDLARQFYDRHDEIQQVRLDIHFDPREAPVLAGLRATACAARCVTGCTYGGWSDLVSQPCTLYRRGVAPAGARRPESITVWSYVTGDGSSTERAAAWRRFIESSPELRAILTADDALPRYEVAQDAAD